MTATEMQGLKPFEDTIYIDIVPVIEYKSGTVQYKVVEQKKIYAYSVESDGRMVFQSNDYYYCVC